MTLDARITALAQAVGADIKALQNADGGGSESPPNSMAVTYTSGRVATVTEDAVTATVTYNADGTVHTVHYPRGGKARTETYSYTSGVLTGMTATEI